MKICKSLLHRSSHACQKKHDKIRKKNFISQRTFENFFSSARTHRLFSRFGRERRDPGHSQLHVCSFVRDHQRLQTFLSTEQMPERCKVRGIVEQLQMRL